MAEQVEAAVVDVTVAEPVAVELERLAEVDTVIDEALEETTEEKLEEAIEEELDEAIEETEEARASCAESESCNDERTFLSIQVRDELPKGEKALP